MLLKLQPWSKILGQASRKVNLALLVNTAYERLIDSNIKSRMRHATRQCINLMHLYIVA